jgi:hypothetical protein
MRIGRRLFPYPILNSIQQYSQFIQSKFKLEYEEILSETDYILKDLSCNLTNPTILNLINNHKAKIVCLIECPATLFRKSFEISLNKIDLHIPLADLNGKIMVSAFVVASEDIESYKCPDFHKDYRDYSFSIEKYDILAADDGFINKIEFTEDDNKQSSIFIVVKDRSIIDEVMNIEFDTDKITIYLPDEQYNSYYKTKKLPKFQNLYYSIIAIPALTYALTSLQKNYTSVDQLKMDYKWFNSFTLAYKKIHGIEIVDEEFLKMDTFKEAQVIFSMAVTKALNEIFDLTMGEFGGVDDAD